MLFIILIPFKPLPSHTSLCWIQQGYGSVSLAQTMPQRPEHLQWHDVDAGWTPTIYVISWMHVWAQIFTDILIYCEWMPVVCCCCIVKSSCSVSRESFCVIATPRYNCKDRGFRKRSSCSGTWGWTSGLIRFVQVQIPVAIRVSWMGMDNRSTANIDIDIGHRPHWPDKYGISGLTCRALLLYSFDLLRFFRYSLYVTVPLFTRSSTVWL